MRISKTIKKRIQSHVAKIWLSTIIHPFFYGTLTIIRIISNLIFLESTQIFQIFGIPELISSAIDTLLYITLAFQILCIMILLTGLILQIQQRHNSDNQKLQSNQKLLIRRLTCDLLSTCRLIIIMPITIICFDALSKNSSTSSLSVSIVNLVLLHFIIYPIAGLIFFNKIVRKTNILSFAYLINTESILFVYIPIMILIKVFAQSILPYINLIINGIMFVTIYYHPIITFQLDVISRYSCSFIQTTMILSSLYSIFSIRMNTIADLIFFILMNIIFGYFLSQIMSKRLQKSIKLRQNAQSNIAQLNNVQQLFYYLIEFSKNKQQMLLFLLNLKRQSITNENKSSVQSEMIMNKNANLKTFNPILQNSSRILSQNQSFQTKDIICQLVQLLKNNKQDSQQFQQLYYELIVRMLRKKCDPQYLLNNKLGNQQISIQIMHNPNIYIIIAQILMLKKNSIRKSYFLIKAHQQILKKIENYSFISGIQIYSLLMSISQHLQQQKKKKQHNLKAQYYFDFQTKYEQLKQLIQKSAEICYDFWNQVQQKQPNIQKANKLIQSNFFYTNKIQQKYNNILINFERKSPLVLFDVVSKYSSIILNNKIPSLLNPFNNLIVSVKNEIYIQRIQGSEKIPSKHQINYSLLQDVAVCVIDIQSNFGNIQWGNEIFWATVYFRTEQTPSHKNFIQKKQNCSILDIMLTQFIPSHKCQYFKDFAQGQHFNYKHKYALIYSSTENTVERVLIEMQILPSIQNGLKLSVFIRKKINQNFYFLDLIADQNFKLIAWSKNLITQSKNMFQKQQVCDEQALQEPLQFMSNLLNNQTFAQFLKRTYGVPALKNSYQSMEQLKSCLKLKNNDYNFSLKSKIKYLTQEQYKDSKNIRKDAQKSERYLIHIQFSNTVLEFSQRVKLIDEHSLSTNSPQSNQSKYNEVNQSCIKSFQSNIFQLKKESAYPQSETPIRFKQRKQTMLPFEIVQQVQQKSQKIVNSDRKYTSLVNTKSPAKISFWRHLVTVLISFLILIIIANIIIPFYRQQVYNNYYTIIQYYNELIAQTARILITLRGLNSFAAIDGVNDPHLPFYKNQLDVQALVIASKISKISTVMTYQWQAYQYLDSGILKIVSQNNYLVYSNYMLSSITYISKLSYEQMAFPIITSMYDIWGGITAAQRNFQSAMFNGVWAIMINMNKDKTKIMDNISYEILPIYKQIFIFSTIGSLLIILSFFIYSVYVESKSQRLKKFVYKLLQVMPISLCHKKKQIAKLFIGSKSQTKENQTITKQGQNRNKQIKFADFLLGTNNLKGSKNQSSQDKNNFFSQNNEQTDINQSETVRQLNKNQSESRFTINPAQKQKISSGISQFIKVHSNKQRVSSLIYKSYLKTEQKPASIYIESSNKQKILFYLIISLPFIFYFVFMFIQAVVFNQKMMNYLNIQSNLYARQSNMEYVYAWTRQTATYQQTVIGRSNWTKHVVNQIQSFYNKQRQFQAELEQMDSQSRLRNYLASIQTADLCSSQLQFFNQSIYFGITFSFSECTSLSQSIMTQGLRPVIVYYMETAIILMQRYSDPGNLSLQKRIQFIHSIDLKLLKTILAYLQQIFRLTYAQFQIDFRTLIDNYIKLTIIYSLVTVITVLMLFVVIYYRWKLVMKQKKQIKSIIQLISYQTLKNNDFMFKQFQKIQTTFYQ